MQHGHGGATHRRSGRGIAWDDVVGERRLPMPLRLRWRSGSKAGLVGEKPKQFD